MRKLISMWSKVVIVVLAAGTMLFTANDLRASTAQDCPVDPPNGLFGVCTGQLDCEQTCELAFPGSMAQCGECCACQL